MSKDISIFISYAHKDDPDNLLCNQIHNGFAGDLVWFDRSLTGGKPWYDQIIEKIKKYDIFLIFFSKSWLQSTICQKELDIAFDENKRLIPLQIETLDNQEDYFGLSSRVHEMIKKIHWIPAYKRESDGKFNTRTIVDLTRAIESEKYKRGGGAKSTLQIAPSKWCEIETGSAHINGKDAQVRQFKIQSNRNTSNRLWTFYANEFRHRSWWHYSQEAYNSRLAAFKPDIIFGDEVSSNWYDAVAYSKWYSKQEQQNCRLPTVAEFVRALKTKNNCFEISASEYIWTGSPANNFLSYYEDIGNETMVVGLNAEGNLDFKEVDKSTISDNITIRLVYRT